MNIDDYKDYVCNEDNGMAIRTGTEIQHKKYIILVDIDNKETKSVKNGLTFWKELIKDKKITTPTQKTGNGGLHYLFKIPSSIFETLPASGTELEINGTRYAIDFKVEKLQ